VDNANVFGNYFSGVYTSQEEYHHFSDKVEMEYRLFLAIDMSLYRHNKIFLEGVQNFIHCFFKNPIWPPTPLEIIKRPINDVISDVSRMTGVKY